MFPPALSPRNTTSLSSDALEKCHLLTVQNQNQCILETVSQQFLPLGSVFWLCLLYTNLYFIKQKVSLFSIINRIII